MLVKNCPLELETPYELVQRQLLLQLEPLLPLLLLQTMAMLHQSMWQNFHVWEPPEALEC